MKKKNYRLFFSIFKENLTDIEALDGVKKWLSEVKEFSSFVFYLFIVIMIGFAGIWTYNLLTGASVIQFLITGFTWGGFCLLVNEIYFRLKRRKLDKLSKKLASTKKEAKRNATRNKIFA